MFIYFSIMFDKAVLFSTCFTRRVFTQRYRLSKGNYRDCFLHAEPYIYLPLKGKYTCQEQKMALSQSLLILKTSLKLDELQNHRVLLNLTIQA